jgi:4-hydroxy-4-methyl-2-oxoglutarate aldolase
MVTQQEPLSNETMDMVTSETLAKLAKYDTPTICNVIELFDVRPRNRGYMDGRIRADFPEFPPMVGFAATASFRSDAPPVGGDAYGSIDKQLEQFASLPGPPVVVFQDLDDPPAAAVFGEVMCSTYKAYGSVGLVTSGAGRDLHQVRALWVPRLYRQHDLFAWLLPHAPSGSPRPHWWPDGHDRRLLHGDANGVTNVPIELAARRSPDVADEFIAAEEIMLRYVKADGPKDRQTFASLRAEFQDVVAKLQKRVKS